MATADRWRERGSWELHWWVNDNPVLHPKSTTGIVMGRAQIIPRGKALCGSISLFVPMWLTTESEGCFFLLTYRLRSKKWMKAFWAYPVKKRSKRQGWYHTSVNTRQQLDQVFNGFWHSFSSFFFFCISNILGHASLIPYSWKCAFARFHTKNSINAVNFKKTHSSSES